MLTPPVNLRFLYSYLQVPLVILFETYCVVDYCENGNEYAPLPLVLDFKLTPLAFAELDMSQGKMP
jgi:hypothetical protein